MSALGRIKKKLDVYNIIFDDEGKNQFYEVNYHIRTRQITPHQWVNYARG